MIDSTTTHKTFAYYRQSLWSFLKAHWYLSGVDRVGKRIRMYGRALVTNDGQMSIGDHVVFMRGKVHVELTTQSQGCIRVGAFTQFNYGCILVACRQINIGERCLFGYYVTVLDSAMHQLEPERRHEIPEPEPVNIEDDVWIGTRAIIMPGVTIGRGAVVAAGSIVTKDVAPRTLVAGVPAKFVRSIP